MKSGISFEQGEIILIPFPFTNLKAIKKRPVVVLSKDEVNQKFGDFISCGITSNIQDFKYSILIDKNDLEYGYLPKPSRIKTNVIFTLEKSSAIKSLGKINADTFRKVKEELLKLF